MSRIVYLSLKEQKSLFSLGILGGLIGGAFVLSTARDWSFFCAILRSTRKLHDKMTLAVIKAPVLFFDTNPAGRIMNRFSKDIGGMDDLLPMQFNFAFVLCLKVIAILILAVVVNFWIICAIIPIGILFFYISRYYLKTARELKRMEAIRCSPIYAHVVETLAGLEVIRTSNMQNECCDKMYR
jgi:ABC-type multidrug transport system fused ATPase/permease subunit